MLGLWLVCEVYLEDSFMNGTAWNKKNGQNCKIAETLHDER
jgi:hypothetical protein